MSEKRITCGFREPKKNYRRGTMQECAEMNKVMYYGIKKIDSRTLELVQRKKSIAKDLEKLKVKLVGAKSVIKKLKADITAEKDKKKKKKLEKELEDKEKKFDEMLRDYQSLKAGKEAKKSTKSKKSKKSKK